MLFPTKKVAEHCRSFIERRLNDLGSPGHARLVQVFVCCENRNPTDESVANSSVDLHIVLFPKDAFPIAKEFWQHTGLGISSRLAEKCLSLLPEGMPSSPTTSKQSAGNYGGKKLNRHYSSARSSDFRDSQLPLYPSNLKGEDLCVDRTTYVEERYGRNLPTSAAAFAKQALKFRIAGVLVGQNHYEYISQLPVSQQGLMSDCNDTVDIRISPDDVYIYPSGMAAIWSAHDILLSIRSPAKSVCFGFVLFLSSTGFN